MTKEPTIREILIELGNIGIPGTLKPNEYYTKKLDLAHQEIRKKLPSEKDLFWIIDGILTDTESEKRIDCGGKIAKIVHNLLEERLK